MTTLDRLERRLNAAGIPTKRAALYNVSGDPGPVPVLIALHDYEGPRPTREALNAADTVRRICSRYNVRADMRGHKQATYIRESPLA